MRTRVELPPEFGRYRILRKLGEGGMGAVYLAEDTQLSRQVALKVPHFCDQDHIAIERFQREARIAAAIEHPNICPVYDIGRIDEIHYLTMPFIEGVPLSQKVESSGPLSPSETVPLIRRLALAVGVLHGRGVIHRDLKPSNILLRPDGEPVVMDFGLARAVSGSDRLTATGTMVGTPAYMSPEQILGEQESLGPTTDVYSLGVILFELLTGRAPFRGSLESIYGQILHGPPLLPSQVCAGLDARLDTICLKAMAKKPEDRYPEMRNFAEALSDFLGKNDATFVPTMDTAIPDTREVPFAKAMDATAAPTTKQATTKTLEESSRRIGASNWRRKRTWIVLGTAVVLVGILLWQLDPLFQRLDRLFHPPDPITARMEAIRERVTPRASKDPKQVDVWQGRPRHLYTIWLDAPDEVLDEIKEVVYHFDTELFAPNPIRPSEGRATRFQTRYTGTGSVNRDMDIVLNLKDGLAVILKFNVYEAIYGR